MTAQREPKTLSSAFQKPNEHNINSYSQKDRVILECRLNYPPPNRRPAGSFEFQRSTQGNRFPKRYPNFNSSKSVIVTVT